MKPIKKVSPGKKNVTPKKVRTSKESGPSFSLIDSMESHFSRHANNYLILCLVLAVVLSLLCFDVKISTANDDALYIESGASFAKNFFGYFYLANAPLYPMILGLLIKIFGVKLIILKCFSIVFFCGGLFFLFQAFRNRIPYVILVPSLLLTSVNFPFLMYASLTYSECLYLLMIGFCFLVCFRSFDKIFAEGSTFKDHILPALFVGSTAFLFLITRNIALVAIVPLTAFLIYRKKYAESAISISAFAGLYFAYRLILKVVWHVDQSQYEGQKLIFQKDAYNPALGMETIPGYFNRLIENSQIYISQRFMYVLGFKEEVSGNNVLVTLVFIGLVLWSLYLMFKNRQYPLLFSTLFFCCLLGANFIALQTSWGQTRFIMIYLPLILMSLFYLLYHYAKTVSLSEYLFPFAFFILLFSSVRLTFSNIAERLPVLIENIKGDPTYGYTPDWQNYIRMTQWCAKNLPNEMVAVRKAPMSFIFSEGKEFAPIYNTPTQNPDSLLLPLRQEKVNYIMPAELRLDPNRYIEGEFIGTVHRYMYYILQKYPDAFAFVHQEGEQEKAQLYKIRWDYIDSLKAISNP